MIDGQPMATTPPYMRPVGLVFQNYAIFPHLDVRGNIAYGLRKQKLAPARQAEMVEEMLELVQLPGYGARRANELSGGQRQRVALARALILRPKVLLLDEPLGALDKQLRDQMQVELRRLQRSVGITFVFVTHDQEEALTLSDRIAVMDGGRVLQVDTPDGLYEAPASRKVAGFVGSMNFFDARIGGRLAGSATVDIEGLGARQIADARLDRIGRSECCVAIRPEKFALNTLPPAEAAASVQGVVESCVYLGERSHVHVKVTGRVRPILVSATNASLRGEGRTLEGKSVWLTCPDDALIPLAID
jgi:ABC-type Fe3+/spermidine/putrescine transport system ATPase subunit